VAGLMVRYFVVQTIKDHSSLFESARDGRRPILLARTARRLLAILTVEAYLTVGLIAQTTFHAYTPAQISARGVTGLPMGPSHLPSTLTPNPANDAMVRNNAWTAYNTSLHQIPTAPNPNRLAPPQQKLIDQDQFIQRPNSVHRYNFQFSDNEIRSVQGALRRMGIYSGQTDGILGPDTQRAIEMYQIQTKRPVTGQPDQSMNAALGIP
jgi:Putative peptidoglycan binding domain